MPASTRERRGPIGPRLATLTAAGALCLGPAAHAVQPSSPPPANANAKENASTTPSIAPGPFTLQSADEGIGLSAVFTLPEGDGPFPAAVLINSAGPQDTAGTVFDRPIARLIADHLARLGIASVRFADRGTDGSDGRFGATLDDVALDAAGGLAFLKAHDRIDADRVAYIGYGDGGLAAIKAAMRADRPAALVLLCTPAAPGGEVLSDHQARLLAAGGVEAEAVDAVVKAQRALVEAIRADDGRQALGDRVTDLLGAQYRAQFGRDIPPEVVLHNVGRGLDQARSPAVRTLIDYDPAADLRRVRVPVLALFGGRDLQSSVELNAVRMAEALGAASSDARVVILPRLNHLMQRADTGLPSEYRTLGPAPDPAVLRLVGEWLVDRLDADS